jgi:hypothetical protein
VAIADDFSVAANGDIRWTGTTATYTVLELHRFLQDLADDAVASGNDLHDITDTTSSDRSTDNIITLLSPYNIDDTAAEHLYDGSITQEDGDTVYSGLVVVGSAESGTELQIVQDDALLTNYWTTGINADAAANILLRLIVKTRQNGADIDGKRLRVQARELGDTYAEFSLTAGLGNSTAAIFTSVDLNNATLAATIATWSDIVNTEGLNLLDVDGDSINEEYYSQWDRASRTITQLYERTKWIARRGTSETIHGRNGELFRGPTHSMPYDNESGGPFTEDEILAWGTSFNYDGEANGPFTVGEYVSIGGASNAVGKLVYLDDQGATGTMVVALESGSAAPADNDQVASLTGTATCDINGTPNDTGASGGEGLLLALDDDGTTGNLYIQLLTGSAPVDNLPVYGRTSDATADINGTPTARTVSAEFLGTSTGSAIIGAYGIGIQPSDLTNSDQLFDLSNTLRVPPNNVTFTVSGLVSGEDRVLVGPEDGGGGLDTDQLTGATGSNANGAGTYVCNETIPSDTPSSGTIRVFNGDTFDRVPYTSYTGSTFTLTGTLPSDGASHVIQYDNEASGPFTVGETLTFTGGETAELLTLRDDGATGEMVIRMLTGVDPVDNDTITGGTSSATADVNGTPDEVGAFISYIDELASGSTAQFTGVYSSDRTLFIRARDGGGTPIKTFETTGTLGSGGGSTTIIRTSDE